MIDTSVLIVHSALATQLKQSKHLNNQELSQFSNHKYTASIYAESSRSSDGKISAENCLTG